MFKHLKFAALAVLLSMGFAACSDDDDTVIIPEQKPSFTVSKDAYVILQGNMFGGIMGSVDELNFDEKSVTSSVFAKTNNQSLGDTPQAATRYGSKIYIPVFNSNLVWVATADSLKIVAQIKTNTPQAVCGAEGYVFIANNDGYVSRVDTTNFAAEPLKLQVGPNPAGLAAYGDMVYVTISDGYNSANNCENGKKVVAIYNRAFTVADVYRVGMNPGQIVADNQGNLFVSCRGNYGDVAAKIQKIATDGTVSDFCDGSMIATNGEDLYVLDYVADYANNTIKLNANRYNTLTGAKTENFIDAENQPLMPNAMDINPGNGHIFVCSDKSPMGYADTGYVYEYTKDGQFVHRYDVGIHPYSVVFK